MEIRLSVDKLARIKQLLRTWLPKRKATKLQFLSLVGTLHHVTKVVCSGRAFVTRIYSTAARMSKVHFITKINIILIVFVVVACISSGLEWFQHPQTSHFITPRILGSNQEFWAQNRCFHSVGLCGSTDPRLVTVVMSSRMAEYEDHG